MIESKRVDNQTRSFVTTWQEGADLCSMTVTVRFDDRCRNGHNTFSITSNIRRNGRWESGGCQHELIAMRFPELAPFIKWHLCSTDGPMHYVANTSYWAQQNNLEFARQSAIWPDATIEQLRGALTPRLPALLESFKTAMEILGFTW